MKRLFPIFIFMLLFSGKSSSQQPGKLIIKFATIAPEGSTYMQLAHEIEREIEAESGERVDIRWYAGGVLGDEPDMIRLMKLGQLHGAGLTGMGLGQIDMAVRAVELPFLTNNYSDIDRVLEKVFPLLRDRIRKKNFELIGIAENGFVYFFFTKKPVARLEDLKGLKMWVWSADDFAREAFSNIPGLLPVPLPITDVLTALATGLVEGFYNTPLATLAFQWYKHARYMLDVPVVYGSAWIVMEKKFYDSLDSDLKDLLERKVSHFTKLVQKLTREENEKSLKVILSSGVQSIKPDDKELPKILNLGRETQEKLKGKFIPPEVLSVIREALRK